MRGGNLHHPGTIQELPVSLSSTGSPKPARPEDWVTVAEARAEIMLSTSREVFQARTINAEVSAVLRIRGPRVAINAKMRFLAWDGRVFEITGVRPVDGMAPEHSREILLDCVESRGRQ